MATHRGDVGRYEFGAIGEELEAARMDDIYELNFGGG